MAKDRLFIALEEKVISATDGQYMVHSNILREFLAFLDDMTADALRTNLDLFPPPTESEAFGLWVSSTRVLLRMSQVHLADAAGLSQGDLSRLENNKKTGPPVGKERRERIRRVLLAELRTAVSVTKPEKT